MSATREWKLDCKVYIGDLGDGAVKEEIEDAFSRYGELRNVWIARRPPGFAFVEFADARDAMDACRALDGTRMNGRRVKVRAYDVEMSSGRSRNERGSNNGGRYGGRDSRDDRYRGGDRGDRRMDRGYDRGGRGGYDNRRSPPQRSRSPRRRYKSNSHSN